MTLNKNTLYAEEKKEILLEGISENIKKINLYLSKIPSKSLEEYKKITGKNYITVFAKKHKPESLHFQSRELIAHITPENTIKDLKLESFGHQGKRSFHYRGNWNNNSREHLDDNNTVIDKTKEGQAKILKYEKDILDIQKKMRNEIRMVKFIKPLLNMLNSVA